MGSLQVRVVLLCALVAMLDGFDTQAIAYVAPGIATDWHLQLAAFGPVFAAGLVGLMIGALTLSPIADRLGRRIVIVLCVAAFGGFALLTARTHNLQELLLCRVLTGVGLGGAMPNIIALTSELSPVHRRGSLVTAMFCGFPLGATLGGFLSAPLIEAHGWRAVFILGGLLPLLLLPVLILFLPESLTRPAQMSAPAGRVAVLGLFTQGRAPRTLLVWLAFFMNLLVLYLLTNWLPSLLRAAGMPLSTAIGSTALLNLGGVAGGILLGQLIDRHSPYVVLGIAYAAASVCVAALAFASSVGGLWLLSALAGFGISGAQIGLNAVTAASYPDTLRATGIGWALGVGRLGSILGPAAGGLLLGLGWTTHGLLLTAVIPGLIASAAVLALHYLQDDTGTLPT